MRLTPWSQLRISGHVKGHVNGNALISYITNNIDKNTNKQDRQAQRIVSHRVDLQFTQYQNQRCTTYNHWQTVYQGRRDDSDSSPLFAVLTATMRRPVNSPTIRTHHRRTTRPRRQTNSPVHAADVTSTDDTTAARGRVVRKGKASLGTGTTAATTSWRVQHDGAVPIRNSSSQRCPRITRRQQQAVGQCYPTVTTGRTVLQHDIALLRSRLSVSDTAQLTRPEQENISTATDYKNDGDTPSNTGYQFATTLRNLATSAVHTVTRTTQLVTVSVSDCELKCLYILYPTKSTCSADRTSTAQMPVDCSELHQQPVAAVLRPTFVHKLCYKLPSVVPFTFLQTFD